MIRSRPSNRAVCCAVALLLAWSAPGFARGQSPADGDATTKKPASNSASKTAASKTGSTTKRHTAKAGTKTSSATSHSGPAKTASTRTASGKTTSSRRKKTAKTRGQQKIDPERAKSIQEALIREHYLTGEPSGTWNQTSEEAMRRYQGDHGWQTKEVPDSRALIKLGLGPSNDHLLNPESAMTSSPESPAAGKPAVRPASAVPEDPKRR
jgi:hypothetical protein